MREDACDPLLQLTDLSLEHGPEFLIHGFQFCHDVLSHSRADLSHEPLAHLDHLRPASCQRSENAQTFTRQFPSRLRTKRHESGNEFGINPIGFCTPSTGKGKSLDLGWKQLRGVYSGSDEPCPERPFLTSCSFKADPQRRRQILNDPDQAHMAVW
ncbi:hypothetical protein RAH32_18335 [Paracoccus sp. WLY502]|nr:hypothetical protein [Paracoccus sp. WLY502]MDQ1902382.1 hypothetical protein [Paracoccus sp. WLY502]